MLLLKTLCAAVLIPAVLAISSIYDYSVPISGGSQSLNAFNGKKVLIITLPIEKNEAADSMLYCLDTLASAHSSTLKVIAVPSYEDGYTNAIKDSLDLWYRSKLNSGILITAGLYCRKSSENQHELFKWLTNSELNENFDIDAIAPGFKYFTNTDGKLVGVLVPETKISSKAVQTTLRIQ